jgi:serine protease Do
MRMISSVSHPVWRVLLTGFVVATLVGAVSPDLVAPDLSGLRDSVASAQSPGGHSTNRNQIDSIRQTPTVRAIKKARPCVVNIHGQKIVQDPTLNGSGRSSTAKPVNGMGTGVIIDPRGYVITNYHVVEDVPHLKVTLDSGEETTAELVAARIRNDLALIKIHTNTQLPTITRGTSEDLMVGESVIAIGNAYGYVHTTTEGIISALHRDIPVNETQEYLDLIQISAGINPGNSGGPLLNIQGDIIGINVAVRVGAQQIAFAIPIDQVIETVTSMVDEHNEERLMLGMRTGGGPRDGDGIFIASVSANSLAAREGLQIGDRVVRVGSMPVDDKLDLALALIEGRPGQSEAFEIVRDGNRYELVLQMTEGNGSGLSAEQKIWQVVGIQAQPIGTAALQRINSRMRTPYKGGLYVTNVRPGSAAAAQGIENGDVLLGIHGWQTPTQNDLAAILDHPAVRRGPNAKFYIIRQEQTLYGHMQLAAQDGGPTVR